MFFLARRPILHPTFIVVPPGPRPCPGPLCRHSENPQFSSFSRASFEPMASENYYIEDSILKLSSGINDRVNLWTFDNLDQNLRTRGPLRKLPVYAVPRHSIISQSCSVGSRSPGLGTVNCLYRTFVSLPYLLKQCMTSIYELRHPLTS